MKTNWKAQAPIISTVICIVIALATYLIGSAAALAQEQQADAANHSVYFESQKSGFDIVALGTGGGVGSDNLSAFLIGPHQQALSVACDAGSLVTGIEAAIEQDSFSNELLKGASSAQRPYSLSGYILREHIKAYLISHGHLDHVAGLIIASPDDSSKAIYALEPVLKSISESYFNWQTWPNFAASGASPALGKYRYAQLIPYKQAAITNTPLMVTAFPLSHNGIVSTAFVIEYQQDIVVCIGDTGPDSVEQSDNLKRLWQFIAPYIQAGKLKALIIESSYANNTPDNRLYGHLTPRYIHQEMNALAAAVGDAALMKGLAVIISHIKPSIKRGEDMPAIIKQQLAEQNELQIDYIIPTQGQAWHFE